MMDVDQSTRCHTQAEPKAQANLCIREPKTTQLEIKASVGVCPPSARSSFATRERGG